MMRDSFMHLVDRGGAASTVVAVEQRLSFGTGIAEVRKCSWDEPSTSVWSCDGYFLTYPLARKPRPAWGAFLDTPAAAKGRIGRIMFVPARQTVQTGGDPGTQRSLSLMLASEMFENLGPHIGSWNAETLTQGLALHGADLEWLLLKIYAELRQGGFGNQIVIESLATAMLVTVIRKLGLHQTAPAIHRGGLAPWRMRRIRERVQDELPPPSLSALAQLCGMSVRHLGRAFKAETGQTIAQYVQDAITERALFLLVESDASINDIARELGFSTATGFSSAFRRATGMLPSEVDGRRRPRRRTGEPAAA